MTEPTDAEILALIAEKKPTPSLVFLAKDDAKLADLQAAAVAIARAVLAKWGTPPAVAGEPVAWMGAHDNTDLYYRKPPQADVVPLYTTPQPTQAQAGAELAEADRRAGAAERELACCREDVARFTRVRDQMKEQWGVDRNVSFDVVWAEALRLKQQAGAVPLTPDQVVEIADAAHREYDRLVTSGKCAPRWSAVFAHLLERAHGIGIKGGCDGDV